MIGPVEVTGLALAMVPIIQAASNYKAGSLKPAFHQKTKDNRMADYYQNLNLELSFLDLILRELVSSLSTIPKDTKKSLFRLDPKPWNDHAVSQALQEKLGNSYQAFRHIIVDILKRLEEIISTRSLGLRRTDLLAQEADRPLCVKLERLRKEGCESSESIIKRIRFTSKEGKLRRNLDVLKEKIKMLERLVCSPRHPDHRIYTEDTRAVHNCPSRNISELAQTAYNSLAKLCSCTYPNGHEVRLCMNIPFDIEVDSSPTRLDMFIAIKGGGLMESWQESSIHLDDDISAYNTRIDSPIQVRFSDIDETQEGDRGRRRSSANERLNNIGTICSLVDRASQNDVVLEMLLKGNALFHIESRRRRIRVQEANTTLDKLFNKCRPTVKDRRKLAVVLAHALLHLKESRWMKNNWTKADVCFMASEDNAIDLSRPYLASRFRESDSNTTEESDQLHKCRPLLELGIILLELGVSAPLDTQRTEQDLVNGHVNENTDFFTANRLLLESTEDLQDDYREAVSACLHYKFASPESSFDFGDEEFRRLIYEHVIKPLERELLHGWGTKPKDLWRGGLGSSL